MTTRKNYNSILFLTVYLGLVLVGGSSQVFAHAATNSLFDLRNEIEFKDDLDNQPDEEKINSSEKADTVVQSNVLEIYLDEVEKFIQDLQKLHRLEKFDLDDDTFEISELGFVPCNVAGDPVRKAQRKEKIDSLWLKDAIREADFRFQIWNFLSDCLQDDQFETGLSKGSRYGFSYDKSDLKVEVSSFKTSPSRAIELSGKLNDFFRKYKIGKDEKIIKVIYENTKVSSENNQILIVTRLPRASIDSLLKQSALSR